MLVNQRLRINVRQDITAVSDKRIAGQNALHILNAAAGLQQLRLVHERNWAVGVAVLAKKVSK